MKSINYKSALSCSFFLLIFIVMFSISKSAADELIEQTNHGSINWCKRIITAEGTGKPPADSGTPIDFSNPAILNDANKQAISNLFGTILKVRINSTLTVGDAVSKDQKLFSQLESMVMKSESVNKNYITDGTVYIKKQFNMDGGFFQLILPSAIKQFEPIKPLTTTQKEKSENGKKITGIIIDASAIGFKPVITPVIFSENDKPVFSPIYINRAFGVRYGVCEYASSINDKTVKLRSGKNPLLIKGLKTDEKNSDKIIISSNDASKVLSVAENLLLLNQCKVVIITDYIFK